MLLRDSLIPKFAQLIYYGFWYSPEMEALRTMIDKTQENVTAPRGSNSTRETSLSSGGSPLIPSTGRISPHLKRARSTIKWMPRGSSGLNALRLRIRSLMNK